MYTANQHVALAIPALEMHGPRYILDGVLYLSSPDNVALQPILTAVLLYFHMALDVQLRPSQCFQDDYLGKTIDLDKLKGYLGEMYPEHGSRVKAFHDRFRGHLQGNTKDRKGYEITLDNVIKDFHDEQATPICIPTPVLTQDAVAADAK